MQMLPTVTKMALAAARHRDPEARQEFAAEAVAHALLMFASLVAQGRGELAYAGALALYAIKRVKIGRKAATPMNCNDISSQHCQMTKGLTLGRLDRFDTEENAWREVVVQDRHVGPAEVVATKLDFESWLRSLPRRTRKIAATLATGETTTRTARRFRVSAGRISQMRRELMGSWCEFVGDAAAMGGAVGAVA